MSNLWAMFSKLIWYRCIKMRPELRQLRRLFFLLTFNYLKPPSKIEDGTLMETTTAVKFMTKLESFFFKRKCQNALNFKIEFWAKFVKQCFWISVALYIKMNNNTNNIKIKISLRRILKIGGRQVSLRVTCYRSLEKQSEEMSKHL